KGNFRSPYSAEYMGAQTDDYSTLSSQNYLALALTLLYQQSGREEYLDAVRGILDFTREWLYDSEQHRILHHWMDGAIAQPDHPEYFCSGCNLQTLYVIWYLYREVLGTSL
ncbi:MAG: hypothetical protein KC561_12185, partial [Myxococcales bacterium]|nr:hypothetical protein [Myxococcales bacterium]